MKFSSKFINFHTRKSISKCSLELSVILSRPPYNRSWTPAEWIKHKKNLGCTYQGIYAKGLQTTVCSRCFIFVHCLQNRAGRQGRFPVPPNDEWFQIGLNMSGYLEGKIINCICAHTRTNNTCVCSFLVKNPTIQQTFLIPSAAIFRETDHREYAGRTVRVKRWKMAVELKKVTQLLGTFSLCLQGKAK